MEIKGIVRINMTGDEIESALLKASELPTADELQQSLDNKQDLLDFATDADIEAYFGDNQTQDNRN